jgi:gamma-soluble NSF attachment protein
MRNLRAVENINPEKALPFFIDSCELYVDEGKKRLGVESFKKVISLFIKANDLQNAVVWSNKLCELMFEIDGKHLTNRSCLTSIILLLAFGDEVEAGKKFGYFAERHGVWVSCEEGQIANDLLDAYEKRDQKRISEIMKKQLIGFLDNEVAKVARKLVVPGGNVVHADLPPVPPENSTSLVDEVPQNMPSNPEESNDLC